MDGFTIDYYSKLFGIFTKYKYEYNEDRSQLTLFEKEHYFLWIKYRTEDYKITITFHEGPTQGED